MIKETSTEVVSAANKQIVPVKKVSTKFGFKAMGNSTNNTHTTNNASSS